MKNNKLIAIGVIMTAFLSTGLKAQDVVASPMVEEIVIGGYGERTQDLSKLPKMQRDIEILKNVLRDLFYGENNFFGSRSTEGIHIEGKGVMFSMAAQNRYGNVLIADELTVIDEKSGEPKDEKDVKTLNQEAEDMIKRNSQDFLINYASLLSELGSDEMVMLNIDYSLLKEKNKTYSSGAQTLYFAGSRSAGKRMVSSINAKDIEAFLSGKLSESDVRAKVTSKIIDKGNDEKPDAKILAGIFDNLFGSVADGKFKRRGRTTYTYFDGFGLMYNLKFTSNTSRNVVFATTTGTLVQSENNLEEAKKREEYYKGVEEAFPDFERQLKQNILEYGRTLRSVKDNEVIIVNVDMGSTYRKSKIPRSLQMVIPKSLINDYAKGGISLEKAADKIDIKKLSTAISGSGVGTWSVPAATEPAVAVGYIRNSEGQN